jgi:hypothetical protein
MMPVRRADRRAVRVPSRHRRVAIVIATARTPAHDDPPDDAAAGKQHERSEPQQPRRTLDRRIVEDEVAIARDEVLLDLVVVLALQRELAHLAPEVIGERGIGVRQRLILADEAAQLLLELLQARVERRVRLCEGAGGKGQQRDQENLLHAFCSSRTRGMIFFSRASVVTGPICL